MNSVQTLKLLAISRTNWSHCRFLEPLVKVLNWTDQLIYDARVNASFLIQQGLDAPDMTATETQQHLLTETLLQLENLYGYFAPLSLTVHT